MIEEQKNKLLHTRRGCFSISAKILLNSAHELPQMFSGLGFIPTHVADCYEGGELNVRFYGLSERFDSINDGIEPIEYDVSMDKDCLLVKRRVPDAA